MIEDKILYNGQEYIKKKKIKGMKKTYIEYRNESLQKIKFFEISKGCIAEITDKEDLRKTIEENYIVE